MDINFHYYVTYTAAVKAGFSAADAAVVARAAQYVDECYGETVQSTTDLVIDNILDSIPFRHKEIREILDIWPVFHFLPGDRARIENEEDAALKSSGKKKHSKALNLICGPESRMTGAVVKDARDLWGDRSATQQQKLLRVGITMHVLADTYAHQGFAGVPLREVNEVKEVQTLELVGTTDGLLEKNFRFLEKSPALSSSSFGYLGHGRIGHLPDQPGCTFYYKAQWHDPQNAYIARCNPLEFYCAYLIMIEAMEYIRGAKANFSNQVDRALLLDDRRDKWPETRRFIDLFNAVNEDRALVRPWFMMAQGIAVPAAYAAYDGKREAALLADFKAMAKAFHDCVFQHCDLLQEYYNLC